MHVGQLNVLQEMPLCLVRTCRWVAALFPLHTVTMLEKPLLFIPEVATSAKYLHLSVEKWSLLSVIKQHSN